MLELLIVDRVHPCLADTLSAKGLHCVTDTTLTREAFIRHPDNLTGLVIRNRFIIDREVLDSKPSLRFIVRIGSGVENIDTIYAAKKGVEIISTPEGNAHAVAEHCLGLLLTALRHISQADREVRTGEWLREKNKGTELQSHTYGIIGYGHTGPAFAKLLSSLGCRVFAYDKYNPHAGDEHATMTSLADLTRQCDVISLHINYMPENKYFIDEEFIRQVAHPFLLINSSRGLVVDTGAVVRHLQDGKILYACLDVLEYENAQLRIMPVAEWPTALRQLAVMENVILTPHTGGQTFEAELRHARLAVDRILKITQL